MQSCRQRDSRQSAEERELSYQQAKDDRLSHHVTITEDGVNSYTRVFHHAVQLAARSTDAKVICTG